MSCFGHAHMPSKVLAIAGGISLVRTARSLLAPLRVPGPAWTGKSVSLFLPSRTHRTTASCRRADVLSDHSAAVRLSLAPVDNI